MFTIDNIMSDTLGERIRELRLARGWSLRQLGSKARISGAYIHQLESGTRQRPNIQMVTRIAAAFGISLDTLVGTEQEGPPLAVHENGVEYMTDVDGWIEDLLHQFAPNVPPQDAITVLEGLDKLPQDERRAWVILISKAGEKELKAE